MKKLFAIITLCIVGLYGYYAVDTLIERHNEKVLEEFIEEVKEDNGYITSDGSQVFIKED